ncbi:MAG: hypothetical protein ABEN55_00545 [Bradymonadaceae bacterium]
MANDAKRIRLYCLVPHVWQLPIRAAEEDSDGNKPIVDRVRIAPGRNVIDEDKWEQVDKDDPRVESRLDKCHIKVEDEPSELEKDALDGRPSPKLVSSLCDKAEEIPTFDESNPGAEEHQIFE